MKGKSALPIIGLAVVLLLTLFSCSKEKYRGMPPASVLDEASTEVDSLYTRICRVDSKEIIPVANQFFHQLYQIDVTDTLTQYSTTASVTQVQADAAYWMGEYLLAEERYDEALTVADVALNLATEIDNEQLAKETHSLLSVIYFRKGLVNEAIDNLKICFEADSRNNDLEAMSSDLNNLAAMSLQAKQYDNARDYIDRAIQIERALDRPNVLAIRLGIASETYAALDMLPEAEAFAREAYKIDIEDGRDCKAAIRLSQLATVLIKEDKTAEALSALNTAAPMLKECGNMYSYIITQCQLGDIQLQQHADAEAARHYREALDMADKRQMMYLQQRALKGLWLALKTTNMAEAAPYIERYAAVTDSMFSNKTTAEMAQMQSRFEHQELAFENERLQYQMRTHRLVSYGIALIVLLGVLWLLYALHARNMTNKTIRNLERIRSNFFTNITHEFRTPLTAIIGLSRDIANKKFENQADCDKAVEIINRQSNDLLRLVNQLLDISKVKSQVGNPDWRHGDIVSYVKMTMQNYRHLATDKQIELSFSCAHTSLEMDFVPDYIRKIVGNMIANAIKFTPRDGHILLELLVKGNNLAIRISDDGRGIEKSKLPNIFDPYYSGNDNEPDTSTGIGLSLVNEMVKAMQGHIKVVSQVGEGTIFTITLPITHTADDSSIEQPMSVAQSVSEDNTSDEKSADCKMALIVEDNSDLAFYIGSHMPKDFALYYAQDGKEGLDKAVKIVPDIIITDIMMAEMDGITMIEEIRKNPLVNHIPVVAVTAKVNDSDRIEGLKAGFDAYLAKPFNSEELTIRVAKLLEQRDLLRNKYAEPVRNGQPVIIEGVDETLLLGKLVDYIHSQLDKGKTVDIEKCASYMHYSSRQLSRKIQAITGDTLNKYINRVRVEYAKRLMQENPTLSLLDITVRCGAESPDYFARQFRQYVGLTPTQYLKTIQKRPSASN